MGIRKTNKQVLWREIRLLYILCSTWKSNESLGSFFPSTDKSSTSSRIHLKLKPLIKTVSWKITAKCRWHGRIWLRCDYTGQVWQTPSHPCKYTAAPSSTHTHTHPSWLVWLSRLLTHAPGFWPSATRLPRSLTPTQEAQQAGEWSSAMRVWWDSQSMDQQARSGLNQRGSHWVTLPSKNNNGGPLHIAHGWTLLQDTETGHRPDSGWSHGRMNGTVQWHWTETTFLIWGYVSFRSAQRYLNVLVPHSLNHMLPLNPASSPGSARSLVSTTLFIHYCLKEHSNADCKQTEH